MYDINVQEVVYLDSFKISHKTGCKCAEMGDTTSLHEVFFFLTYALMVSVLNSLACKSSSTSYGFLSTRLSFPQSENGWRSYCSLRLMKIMFLTLKVST